MTNIDPAIVEAVRNAAEAATPGPWYANVLGSEGYAVVSDHPRPGKHRLSRVRVARFGYEDWDTDKANAEYVAAVDPLTVLALLAALDAARAEGDKQGAARVREAVEAVHRPQPEHVGGDQHLYCMGCWSKWPCRTARAFVEAAPHD